MSKWQKVGLFGALVGVSLSIGMDIKGLWDEWREDRALRSINDNRRKIIEHQDKLYEDLIAENQKMLNQALQRSKEP